MAYIMVNYQNGNPKIKNHGCGLNNYSIGATHSMWDSHGQRRRPWPD